jgi:hypothetical protein
MSETNIAAMSGTGPSFVSAEPEPSVPRAPEELMCVNAAFEGGEGASGAGTQALVRRFSDASGAGGGSGYVEAPRFEPSSCGDEALSAIGSCGAAVILAGGTAGIAFLVTAFQCAGALGSLSECLGREEAASKP